MKSTNPIKRSAYIQPYSRDHHHGLLLCWKIKEGFRKQVSTVRMKAYSDWFYLTHLLPHFEAEEKYVFPILGMKNERIQKALKEHIRLKRLFEATRDISTNLTQ